jgi:alpha-beta hydrolase superfamily lysophospholipase
MAPRLQPLSLLASVSLAAVGGVIGAAWYMTERITPSHRRSFIDDYTFTPWELGVPFEEVAIATPDGLRLSGWWLPQEHPKGVVITCHGHTGRKDDMLGIATRSWRAGYAVLLFDFRGRGESDPWPNSLISREVDDLLAAVAYAHQRAPEATIGVMGFSMGAAVSLLTAAREPLIAAVVADSAFTAVSDVVADSVRRTLRLPPEPLLMLAEELAARRHGYRFRQARPIDVISQIAPRPLLIIHGSEDSVVPVSHGHALFAAAHEPKQLWVCQGVEHCGAYFLDRPAYVQRVVEFFDQHLYAV